MKRLIALLTLLLLVSPTYAVDVNNPVDWVLAPMKFITNPLFTVTEYAVAGFYEAYDYMNSLVFGEDVALMLNNTVVNQTLEEKRDFKEYDFTTDSKQLLDLLKEKTASEMVVYTVDTSGNNDITTRLYAPDKIYGYSAFPTKLSITKCTGDSFHVTNVKIYVKSNNNSEIKYYLLDKTYNQTFNQLENAYDSEYEIEGSDTVDTIMKAPDTHSVRVRDFTANANVDYSDIEEILSSNVEPFEIYYEVHGHIEKWVEYTVTGDDGVQREVRKRQDIQVDHLGNTNGLDGRIKNGNYMIGSFSKGSLPVDYLESDGDKLIPYESVCQGSTSNILSVLWSSPVNAVNRSPDMRYVYIDNCGELFTRAGVPAKIYDDVAIVTLRETTNHEIEISSKKAIQKGYFTSVDPIQIYTSYTANNEEDLLDFTTYGIVYGEITRTDGVKIPVWTINKPTIFVYGSERTVAGQTLEELDDLRSLSEWDESSRERVLNILVSTNNSLNNKIATAENYKEKAEIASSSKAIDCADKAIENYKEGTVLLTELHNSFIKLYESTDYNNENKIEEVDDTLEIVRVYEVAGDEFLKASKLYTYGKDEQAEQVEKDAKDLTEKSAVPIFGNGGLIDNTNQFIECWILKIPIIGESLNNLIKNIPFGYVTLITLGLIIVIYQNRSSVSKSYRRYKRRY
ncbi:hypothetical protein [Methanococcus voltae]|uniref:Uncharacterized protein n=1 Tax=Methanococcus voltae (strain ATCC BAA-1334 / A3) TaxID=456320 RepID=D7DS65_METV3|nr:hypothetical protein [Methanococcus voltae]MCS3901501.1 hypothetical protein [Methanococcus voltae]